MPPPKIAKTVAKIMGALLVLGCLMTFLPNPLLASDGYFATDMAHAVLLALFGLALFASSTKGESTATMGLWSVAAFCVLVALLGWNELASRPYSGNASIFGMMLFNRADVWLYVGLALTLFAGGMFNTSKNQLLRD